MKQTVCSFFQALSMLSLSRAFSLHCYQWASLSIIFVRLVEWAVCGVSIEKAPKTNSHPRKSHMYTNSRACHRSTGYIASGSWKRAKHNKYRHITPNTDTRLYQCHLLRAAHTNGCAWMQRTRLERDRECVKGFLAI